MRRLLQWRRAVGLSRAADIVIDALECAGAYGIARAAGVEVVPGMAAVAFGGQTGAVSANGVPAWGIV